MVPNVHIRRNVATLMNQMRVLVIVHNQGLNDLFSLVLTLMIVINTVNMGGQLDLEVIKAVFKRPIGPVVGFVSQFVLMPLVSIITYLILLIFVNIFT